jgi:hypothetical protein
LFFTLIPVLALLSNYDQENCLINVGTEGGTVLFVIATSATTAVAQADAKQQTPVQALVSVVRDVDKFQSEFAKGTKEAFFFALADRNGALIHAVRDVVDKKLEAAGVAELIKIIQNLRQSAKETDGFICANAAFALGQFGQAARSALPTLALLKNHSFGLAKSDAAEAQQKIAKQ